MNEWRGRGEEVARSGLVVLVVGAAVFLFHTLTPEKEKNFFGPCCLNCHGDPQRRPVVIMTVTSVGQWKGRERGWMDTGWQTFFVLDTKYEKFIYMRINIYTEGEKVPRKKCLGKYTSDRKEKHDACVSSSSKKPIQYHPWGVGGRVFLYKILGSSIYRLTVRIWSPEIKCFLLYVHPLWRPDFLKSTPWPLLCLFLHIERGWNFFPAVLEV